MTTHNPIGPLAQRVEEPADGLVELVKKGSSLAVLHSLWKKRYFIKWRPRFSAGRRRVILADSFKHLTWGVFKNNLAQIRYQAIQAAKGQRLKAAQAVKKQGLQRAATIHFPYQRA
ncbi:MAG: hypothetical protein IPL78_12790 [Chloroflexi bacterium]|nr:hypothetical protein [Chloroflexota bacterium]